MTRAMRAILLITMLGVTGLNSAAGQENSDKRPLPDSAGLKQALSLLREVYEQEFSQAKTSAQQSALAHKLLQQANSSAEVPVEQYAMLKVARDVAIRAGDTQTAMRAVEAMGEEFQLDGLQIKAQTITKLARTAKSSAQKKALAATAADLIDEAVADDDYAVAQQLAHVALTAARTSRDRTLIQRVTACNQQLQKSLKTHAQFEQALATLEEKPVDPEANLAAGKYLCLQKGDWQRGGPMLALGSDEALRAPARRELKKPASADEQVALGDAWWEVAQAKKGSEKHALLSRAGHWYQRAKSNSLAGLMLVKVNKRLAEIAQIEQPTLLSRGENSSSGQPPRSRRGRKVYLDDLQEVSSSVGFGTLGKHGETGYEQGPKKVVFRGVAATHALSAHPPHSGSSSITYDLDGKYRTFSVMATILDTTQSPLTFKILADGKLLMQTPAMQQGGEFQPCSLGIKGVRTLKLELHCPGTNANAQGVWIEPYVQR